MSKFSREFVISAQSANLKKNGSYLSDLFFSIPGFFVQNKNHEILYTTLRIRNLCMPNSFYNVEHYDTEFNFSHPNGVKIGLDITPGNYDIHDLLLALNSASNSIGEYYSFKFDEIRSLVYIESSMEGDTFSVEPTSLSKKLGFYKGETSSGGVCYASSTPDLCIPSIFISLDQTLNNNKNFATGDLYFDQIPITIPYGEMIFYSSSEKIIYTKNDINSLSISIKDINGNLMNFRGVNWSITFEVATYSNQPTNISSTSNELKLFLDALFELYSHN